MSSSLCLRCLKRSLVPIESSLPSNAASRAAFSTSSPIFATPPKKKTVVANKGAKQGKTLKLAKKKRVQTGRPPAPGERKAARKRVVLTNANALEVQGLEDLSIANVVSPEALKGLDGRVMGFNEDTIEALRALEGFKPTQGWSLFRRPASLIRRETVEMGEMIQAMRAKKGVARVVLAGDKSSGKSVMQLQSMAMAHLQGCVMVHFHEARDMTIAQTAYHPIKTAEGEVVYVQPDYTKQLLLRIFDANKKLLSKLRLSKQHQLPIPVQSNISLDRFVELGAKDAQLAYPIWQAFLAELTTPSQPEKEGLQRPPVIVSLDGIDHIMRMSAYLDAESQPVHAHQLAIVRDFTALLSGRTAMPNGGMVLAATNASDRPSAPTLHHYLDRKHAEHAIQPFISILANLRKEAESAQTTTDIDLSSLEDLSTLSFPTALARPIKAFQRRLLYLHDTAAPIAETRTYLSTFDPAKMLPEWNPYLPLDQRVANVMKSVEVKKVEGLSKEEARAVMEYYARSGMLRGTVTEGLVGEKWALSGGGIVGELEKGAVRARI